MVVRVDATGHSRTHRSEPEPRGLEDLEIDATECAFRRALPARSGRDRDDRFLRAEIPRGRRASRALPHFAKVTESMGAALAPGFCVRPGGRRTFIVTSSKIVSPATSSIVRLSVGAWGCSSRT